MDQLTVFIASAAAAAGMYLLLAMKPGPARWSGAAVGLLALAWMGWGLMRLRFDAEGAADPIAGDAPPALFYVFAVIALACAARMITHSRPVYSALYFVLVVLSSAAVFLLLEAEFMAFALVIVYAGAILITYLFVLMLAQQAPTAENTEQTPEYDRLPKEPAAAVAVGFLVLALLAQVVFARPVELPRPAGAFDRSVAMVRVINSMTEKRRAVAEAFQRADATLPIDSRISRIAPDHIVFEVPPAGRLKEIPFASAGLSPDEVQSLLAQNIEQVGFDLVYRFPVSLELAGVILLMAMYGAVVLARKQIELGEDEKREAAGMSRLSLDADAASGGGA